MRVYKNIDRHTFGIVEEAEEGHSEKFIGTLTSKNMIDFHCGSDYQLLYLFICHSPVPRIEEEFFLSGKGSEKRRAKGVVRTLLY